MRPQLHAQALPDRHQSLILTAKGLPCQRCNRHVFRWGNGGDIAAESEPSDMRRVNQDRFRAARKARKLFAEGRACEVLCHQQAPTFSFYREKELLFVVLSSYFAFCRSPCVLAQGTTRPHLSYGASHKHNKPNDQTHSRERSSREPKGLSRAKATANLKQTVLSTPCLACRGLSLPHKC